MCECLEKEVQFPKFQDGTIQGKANGLVGEIDGGTDPFSDLLELQQGHRGAMHDQELHDRQSKMEQGLLWANPNQIPFKKEAQAIKACCDTLASSVATIVLGGPGSCGKVLGASDELIMDHLRQLGSFNTLQSILVNWLQAHDCFHHYK